MPYEKASDFIMTSKLRNQNSSYQNIKHVGILIIATYVFNCVAIGTPRKPIYTVIIDAGSTGSRVQAFRFYKSISNGSLMLDDELYVAIQPGLSSYADDPVKGAKSLEILLDETKAFIPQSEWGSTPLSLKATAGLRLLPQVKADRLLEECRKFFENSGFLISEKSVSIMTGTDEGIFSWLTVNFLFNRQANDTLAALDLGGGSVQVTFAPDSKNVQDHDENVFIVNTVSNNVSIYSHSYLGMGVLAARREILTDGQNVDANLKNDFAPSVVELHSACVNPITSANWSYGGVDYLVKGKINVGSEMATVNNSTEIEENRSTNVRFSECLNTVKKYVDRIPNKPQGLENREIIAFSYYFDRAVDAGLVNRVTGGVTAVGDFLTAAIRMCQHPNINRPFLCLDLIYIYVLLDDGFNLEPSTQLHIYQKIDHHSLSWALGAAVNLVHNGI